MARKGISKDIIIEEAIQLIEQSGKPEISMRALAEHLRVRTPSLYNHVRSVDELLACVSSRAAGQLKEALLAAMASKRPDEAVYALANAYRGFAKEHKGLYQIIMASSGLTGSDGHPAAGAMIDPVMEALAGYSLTREQVMHWQRVLRSIMHGFVSEEEAGFFRRYNVDVDLSYMRAVYAFLCGVKAESGETNHA